MSQPRKNIMLGTAGHVDHGKTALVKLLTGCDTDRLAAEKNRGLTIELGFAPCRMGDERIVGIVDVPGHVDFIRNMVAGAHGIDVVILVIAADDGVMPQTREHLDILTLMGVKHGLVALTKTDLVADERLDAVIGDVRRFLIGTFLEGAAVCPVSNVTGNGFDEFFLALNEEVSACREHEISGLFRLWIERSFNIRGFGTVLSGIPGSGTVKVGDRLQLLPDGLTGRVRGLQVYGADAEIGRAGECVAINLTDIDAGKLTRSKVLVEPDAFGTASMVEADLRILEHVLRGLGDNAEVHLHIGTADVMAHAAILDGKNIGPGASSLVQLRLARPLGIAAGDRFAIRASAAGLADGRTTTIGGGRILDTSNIRLRRNRPWTIAALSARRDALDSMPEWCAVHLTEARAAMDIKTLSRRAQRRAEPVEAAIAELKEKGIVLETTGGSLVHRDVVDQATRDITEALEAFHESNPTRAGIAPAELMGKVQTDRPVVELALSQLIENEKVVSSGAVVALAGRGERLSAEDTLLCRQIEESLRKAGLTPPLPADLIESLHTSEDRFEAITRLLSDREAVIRLDRKVVMHADAVEQAKKAVMELFASKGSFETVEFRDALGVSRKYAVPLLDYFDTISLTVRSGSRRTPGAEAKKQL